MKIGMLFAALLLSNSSATSLFFTAPVGSTRAYEATLTGWNWNDSGPTKIQEPDPTISTIAQSKNAIFVIVTCRIFEEVLSPQDQEKGTIEVRHTTNCYRRNSNAVVPMKPKVAKYLYKSSGFFTTSDLSVASDNLPWIPISSAKKLEHTPWGNLPSIYGTSLENKLEFTDNLHSLVRGDTPELIGTISRAVQTIGQKTLIKMEMNSPVRKLVDPIGTPIEHLFEPLFFKYNLIMGADGRLERGSYRAGANYSIRYGHAIWLMQSEIRALDL
jgi:hypothetical protein